MNEFDEQGRKHGVWRKTSAHIAGEDYVDVTYIHGIVSGMSKGFRKNGTLLFEFTYVNNKMDGPTRWYSEKGIVVSAYNFIHNIGMEGEQVIVL